MSIDIAPISSADYDHARPAFDIINRCRDHDIAGYPPLTELAFRVDLDHPWPGQKQEKYLATLDGVPAGLLELGLPQLDNTDNVFLDLRVDPALRRRGVGTAMLEFAFERTRALGRKRVMASTRAQLPGSDELIDPAFAAFAESFGFKPSLREVRRALDLTTVDDALLDRMLAEAWSRGDGYRMIQWTAPTPDDLIDQVAYLEGRLSTDAPHDDLAIEPEVVDAARVRQAEEGNRLRGRRPYNTGLIHEESGRLVAWTLIIAEEGLDWHGWQYVTVVDPDHRGHRLGTIVKIENLRWYRAQEPTVRVITTFNAASNSFMIDINEKMGFRAEHAFENWQLEL